MYCANWDGCELSMTESLRTAGKNSMMKMHGAEFIIAAPNAAINGLN
jgi:hypothetical protein